MSWLALPLILGGLMLFWAGLKIIVWVGADIMAMLQRIPDDER